MTWTSFALFVSVYAAAVATPGPGMAALVARTLGRGTQGALPFLLGYVVGDLVWFAAAAAGLSLIAKTHASLFEAIKYAGCVYLLWMAAQLWRAPAGALATGPGAAERPLTAFLASLFLTLGNPKVMIFFLSIMPLVVEPEAITWQVGLELAAAIVAVMSTVLLGYVALAERARRLLASPSRLRVVQRANAGILAGAALAIASR